MKLRSIEVWAQHVLDGYSHSSQTFKEALYSESPNLVSAVMERTCNLQCLHCLYPEEKTSAHISREVGLTDIVQNMVRQLPAGSSFLHAGRIVRPWHVEVLASLRALRGSEIALGLIDNGSYTRLMKHFERLSLRLDWIDVSVDGDEFAHNAQRNSRNAYAAAREGIRMGRQVADKVTSLMTLTKLNSHTTQSVIETLLMSGEVDELHFTPASPYGEQIVPLIMGVPETRAAFAGLQQVAADAAIASKIFYRMYRVEDLELLAQAIGHAAVREGLEQGIVDQGRILFHVNGVEVTYFPLSIWPQEEVLIDADGTYRVAGSGQYSLEQYVRGEQNVSAYTADQLTATSDLIASYRKAVRHWWNFAGRQHLAQELNVIGRIMAHAEPQSDSV